jgi:hypothetical protein
MRAKFTTPPESERHINIAILEAWADGKIDGNRVTQKIAEIHGWGVKCARCSEAVEFYRERFMVER